jgi:cytochrome c
MKKIILISLAASMLISAPIFAQSNQAAATLANQSGCLVCHKVDEKLVGPGLRDVAEKYKDQPGSVEKIAQKIKKGGAGSWGRIPMPPHPQLSDESANILAAWVLKGAPPQ